MRFPYILPLLAATVFCHGALAAEASLDGEIAGVSHDWASASYQTPDDGKLAAFKVAIGHARDVLQEFPDRAEPRIWLAIVLSSTAKVQGGLGALGLVKEARDLLLAAERINPAALDGSIYASLGSLYAKVPGWPVAFGDKGKARFYLEKAVAINPTGIDANYFLGDFLADQGEYQRAAEYLRKALAASPRKGREDADAGRRQETMALLDRLEREHGKLIASKHAT